MNADRLEADELPIPGGHLSKELFRAMLKSPPIKSRVFGYFDNKCKKLDSKASSKKSFSGFELYPYTLARRIILLLTFRINIM